MNIQLLPLREEDTIAFKEEIQEAFQQGFQAHFPNEEGNNLWQVLPDKDFYQSLNAVGAEAYEALAADGQRVRPLLSLKLMSIEANWHFSM